MPDIDTATIRNLLTTALSDEELNALCFDHFPEVHRDFAAGMTRAQKSQLLLDYCRRRELFPALLERLQDLVPEQYQRALGQPASPPPPAAANPPADEKKRRTQLQRLIAAAQDRIYAIEKQLGVTGDPIEVARLKDQLAGQRKLLNKHQRELRKLNGEMPPKRPASGPRPTPPADPSPAQPMANSDSAGAPPSPPPNALRRTYALVIGVAAYRLLPRLNKTAADAHDLHALLLQRGIAQDDCALLVDDYATKAAINEVLDRLARCVHPQDRLLIFFNGHGMQRIGGFEAGEYLCPVEADPNHLHASAISSAEMAAALQAIPAGQMLVCLNACHSGGAGPTPHLSAQFRPGLSDAGYAGLARGAGRVAFVSCQQNEYSWEVASLRNSLFAHYLLAGLRGAAAAEGPVGLFNLYRYLSENVTRHAAQLGQQQHTQFKGELNLDWALFTD